MSERPDPSQRSALDRAIDSYAHAEIASVLAEAQAQAREKVRALLAEEIAERLLEEARRSMQAGAGGEVIDRAVPEPEHEPEREPVEVASPAPREEAEEGGLGSYVYCIVGADGLELDGLAATIDDTHPLTLIRDGAIGAVASAVSLEEFGEIPLRERLDDLGWLEDTARAHEEVLDRVREQTTVVPMRLCTVYRSEQSVKEMLAREAPVLEETLARLAGKTEWGVKIFARADELEAELAEQDAEEPEDPLAEARPGEAYMLNRRRETLRKEQIGRVLEERCAQAHEELARLASETVLNRPQPPELSGHTGEMALNGAYLVDDAAVQDFAELVERLQEREGPSLEIELTGPWPPYNFVNSSIEVGR